VLAVAVVITRSLGNANSGKATLHQALLQKPIEETMDHGYGISFGFIDVYKDNTSTQGKILLNQC